MHLLKRAFNIIIFRYQKFTIKNVYIILFILFPVNLLNGLFTPSLYNSLFFFIITFFFNCLIISCEENSLKIQLKAKSFLWTFESCFYLFSIVNRSKEMDFKRQNSVNSANVSQLIYASLKYCTWFSFCFKCEEI